MRLLSWFICILKSWYIEKIQKTLSSLIRSWKNNDFFAFFRREFALSKLASFQSFVSWVISKWNNQKIRKSTTGCQSLEQNYIKLTEYFWNWMLMLFNYLKVLNRIQLFLIEIVFVCVFFGISIKASFCFNFSNDTRTNDQRWFKQRFVRW